jgi:hypothetical protein
MVRSFRYKFAIPQDAKPYRNGWLCKCPAHNDRTASFLINIKEDGSHYGHCFAGCSWDDLKPYAERYYD